MMTATVVMGAGFGDEGKGLITDFEARRLEAGTVVRFNGGAQAGHTVVTEDGRRHVFGHIAAGSFAGAKTYLSQKFIFNPILLEKERVRAQGLGISTAVGVHPRARVSTMYDMVLNSIAELARAAAGTGRHGSCGMGINETVTRHEAGYTLFADDLINSARVTLAHEMIASEWLPQRLEQLLSGVKHRDAIMEKYGWILEKPVADHVNLMLDCCTGINIHTRQASRPVVFEGAQGLRLDEFLGEFPHVTRSITGLPYAILAAESMGVKALQPTYVTRSYTTRHGAGPLPFEGELFSNGPAIVDSTNVTNEWQGSFRLAPLDILQLKRFINADLERGRAVGQAHGVQVLAPTIALTCLDQVGTDVRVITSSGFLIVDAENLPSIIAAELGIPISHVSRGPSAKDVEFLL